MDHTQWHVMLAAAAVLLAGTPQGSQGAPLRPLHERPIAARRGGPAHGSARSGRLMLLPDTTDTITLKGIVLQGREDAAKYDSLLKNRIPIAGATVGCYQPGTIVHPVFQEGTKTVRTDRDGKFVITVNKEKCHGVAARKNGFANENGHLPKDWEMYRKDTMGRIDDQLLRDEFSKLGGIIILMSLDK